ncbi:hypothetical protein GEMRC1_003388 [Eukaryota sp. GEM-RC1]
MSEKQSTKPKPSSKQTVSRKPSEPKNIIHENEVWKERIKSELQYAESFENEYLPVLEKYFKKPLNSTNKVNPAMLQSGTYPLNLEQTSSLTGSVGKLSKADCRKLQTMDPNCKYYCPVTSSMDYGWEGKPLETFATGPKKTQRRRSSSKRPTVTTVKGQVYELILCFNLILLYSTLSISSGCVEMFLMTPLS